MSGLSSQVGLCSWDCFSEVLLYYLPTSCAHCCIEARMYFRIVLGKGVCHIINTEQDAHCALEVISDGYLASTSHS